ncbi:hypothetical protein [Candidatus Sodalis pierantonius]|uniref:hypothetical protein n=1 Tax=Candidatus Sodalis pierantonii TaxID=1486991 RepID=UPI00130E0417|nr:hypothetical protein [Candidatus Sodalis pierantonius]
MEAHYRGFRPHGNRYFRQTAPFAAFHSKYRLIPALYTNLSTTTGARTKFGEHRAIVFATIQANFSCPGRVVTDINAASALPNNAS